MERQWQSSQSHPWDDYVKFLVLSYTFLGEIPARRVKISAPGTYCQARWVKAIYSENFLLQFTVLPQFSWNACNAESLPPHFPLLHQVLASSHNDIICSKIFVGLHEGYWEWNSESSAGEHCPHSLQMPLVVWVQRIDRSCVLWRLDWRKGEGCSGGESQEERVEGTEKAWWQKNCLLKHSFVTAKPKHILNIFNLILPNRR